MPYEPASGFPPFFLRKLSFLDLMQDDALNICFGPYELDTDVQELRRDGHTVSIEPKVFDILVYLVEHRDRTVSKDELIDTIWQGRIVSDAAVTSRMNLVRQAVGDSGREQSTIQTIPKRGFRFVAAINDSDVVSSDKNTRLEDTGTTEASILVLPFKDLSPESSNFLAEGLTEDLIVALSRYSDVSVISLNTALRVNEMHARLENPLAQINADYLIAGAVRVSGEQVRVNIQLSEKATGANVYTEQFDRDVNDIFEIQDEIVRSLAGRLPWRVMEAVGRRISKTTSQRLTSYQALVRACWEDGVHDDTHRFEADVQKIIQDDTSFGPAHAELAFILGYRVFFTGQQRAQELKEALEHARTAIKLAPNNERVLAKSAMVFQFAGQFGVALKLSEQAMLINPNSTDCTHFRATILGASGDAEAALELHKKTMALDPLFPEEHYEGMIEALYLLGRYSDALDLIDGWTSPLHHIHAYGAACAAMAGENVRATTFAAEFANSAPTGYSNAGFVCAMLRYHKYASDRLHWLRGYEAAGIPEMDVVRKNCVD